MSVPRQSAGQLRSSPSRILCSDTRITCSRVAGFNTRACTACSGAVPVLHCWTKFDQSWTNFVQPCRWKLLASGFPPRTRMRRMLRSCSPAAALDIFHAPDTGKAAREQLYGTRGLVPHASEAATPLMERRVAPSTTDGLASEHGFASREHVPHAAVLAAQAMTLRLAPSRAQGLAWE